MRQWIKTEHLFMIIMAVCTLSACGRPAALAEKTGDLEGERNDAAGLDGHGDGTVDASGD